MKKSFLFKLSLIIAMVLPTIGLVSCGGGDDEPDSSFDDPAYLEASAKYTINDLSTGIESIEFTESGYYIVKNVSNNYMSKSIKSGHNKFFGNALKGISRAQYGDIDYGKYTVIAENTYNLIGYGTVTVMKNSGNSVSLNIARNNGSNITTSATVSSTKSSTKTNKLCRAWTFEKIRLQFSLTGFSKFDKTVNGANFNQLNNALIEWARQNGLDAEDIEDFEIFDEVVPEKVIFSRAGTYFVHYSNGDVEVAKWRWDNESKGILHYAWDRDDWSNPDCVINISFSGSNMLINESYSENYEGIKMSLQYDYYMVEDK